MGALDDLLGEFEKNAGTMPQVNPPEAAAVLATKTAPEVAGEPEPPAVEDAPPAPTEKPAEVKAAEAARTRKPRAPKAAATQPASPPDGWDNAEPKGEPKIGPFVNLSTVPTELLRDELVQRGWVTTLSSRAP